MLPQYSLTICNIQLFAFTKNYVGLFSVIRKMLFFAQNTDPVWSTTAAFK